MRVVVGAGSCGLAAGADSLVKELKSRDLGSDTVLEITGCVGMCYLEPIVDIYDDCGQLHRFTQVKLKDLDTILEHFDEDACDQFRIAEDDERILGKQVRIVLRNCGVINPECIDDYIASGGYTALERCVKEMTPEEVIGVIKESGLRGRGGAGFPAWFKWNAARNAAGNEKYMICNADEGDPGAFMDRSILEGDPHALLEGMLIGAYAIGAETCMIYVRAEYPLAIKRLKIAIEQARERGYIGKNVLGVKGLNFEMIIRAGAGAFVCGEETALIASLEGERGMPRLKPPFPAERGYFKSPTNINNVETLANVPYIIAKGPEAFTKYGTERSPGTKVFALTGKIKKGGLVEIPMGTPLKEIIYDIGGGIIDDRQLKGVQMGGPSGGCIPASMMDTPVDYENIVKTGAIVGSGGMVVMDDSTCMVEMARFFLDFTCEESCGKCTYCRLGTKRILEILERITSGDGRADDLELLEEICPKVMEGSLCGLGQTAPNPVLTTMKYFRDEYEAHLDGRCPAKVCQPLIHYHINEKCTGCTICARNCPVGAISGALKEDHIIDQDMCTKCGICFEKCNFDAIDLLEGAYLWQE
ncbi:MAG TPA: NADH-quinone oxidoreductase subunit NuoF [Fastidiosipila sp.]|jgi:NADH-quinone oxidoreductase subunit F|nr:NADH-quinone oxidoreductase subunit NuoF [Eubacteriales bacterium]MDD3611321.1 NADH-quinone oxidoreductase subunit NuoF [Eubacteriales bacterium]HHU04705.1 NADH-quinone oxidoreductase subunit NuoF [Fastidiosipila sp.]